MKCHIGRTQLLLPPDIERGIEIFWTANRGAVTQWTIAKKEKDCGYWANNFSLGKGCAIHHPKDLNATFIVGGKSNWVRPMWFTLRVLLLNEWNRTKITHLFQIILLILCAKFYIAKSAHIHFHDPRRSSYYNYHHQINQYSPSYDHYNYDMEPKLQYWNKNFQPYHTS